MNVLEVDLGNTRSKWRLRIGNCIAESGVCETALFPDQAVLQLSRVEHIWLASVLGAQACEQVIQHLERAFSLKVELAVVSAQYSGVRNAYQEPATMGVDRWLAMLAAYHQRYDTSAGVMVVSCGTAVTLDFICSEGVHEGGYILPGLHLMRESLLTGTGRIRFQPETFGLQRNPGRSTSEAVQQGAVHSVLSVLERSWRDCEARWHSQPELWLTGGDGLLLQQGLLKMERPITGHYEEVLVLNGLVFADRITR